MTRPIESGFLNIHDPDQMKVSFKHSWPQTYWKRLSKHSWPRPIESGFLNIHDPDLLKAVFWTFKQVLQNTEFEAF